MPLVHIMSLILRLLYDLSINDIVKLLFAIFCSYKPFIYLSSSLSPLATQPLICHIWLLHLFSDHSILPLCITLLSSLVSWFFVCLLFCIFAVFCFTKLSCSSSIDRLSVFQCSIQILMVMIWWENLPEIQCMSVMVVIGIQDVILALLDLATEFGN